MCNARLFYGNHEICRFAKCRLILQCNVTEAMLNSRFCSSDDRRAADSNCKIIIENQKRQLLHKTKIIFNIVGYCIQCNKKMNTYAIFLLIKRK